MVCMRKAYKPCFFVYRSHVIVQHRSERNRSDRMKVHEQIRSHYKKGNKKALQFPRKL